MSFWTAIVIIVAIGAFSEVYRSRLKAGYRGVEKLLEEQAQRMTRVEERMANLETIVLEKEKERKFEGLS
jgi:hypothetical protein